MMQNNNTFCRDRFSKYFIWDLKRCWSGFSLTLVILTVMPLIATYVLLNLYTVLDRNVRFGFHSAFSIVMMYLTMLCIGTAMPVKCYGQMRDTGIGTAWITMPASALEKTVGMVILCILALIIGTTGYLAVDALICMADPEYENSLFKDLPSIFSSVDVFPFILYLLGIEFTYIWGAIFFKRAKIAKTSLIIIVLAMALWLLLMLGSYLFVAPSNTLVLAAFILLFTAYDTLVLYMIYRRLKTINH